MLVPWAFRHKGGARGMGVVGAGLGFTIAAAAAAAAVVGGGDGDGEGYGEGHGGGRGEGDEDEEGSGVKRALARSVLWAEGVESPAAMELVPVVVSRADSFLMIWMSLPMPEMLSACCLPPCSSCLLPVSVAYSPLPVACTYIVSFLS